jgi:phage baseplate assembly protein V
MLKVIDERIRRKLAGIRLAFRGVITLVKAAGAVQLVQLDGLSGEQLQDAELFQQYGCTSNPPPGAMCIVLPLGGRTAHGVVIATEHGSYRLKGLKSGEVALYSDEGDSVILKRGRIMEVTTETFRVNASTAIELNSPTVTASADFVAEGDISDQGNKSMADMRTVFNTHPHAVSGAVAAAPVVQM